MKKLFGFGIIVALGISLSACGKSSFSGGTRASTRAELGKGGEDDPQGAQDGNGSKGGVVTSDSSPRPAGSEHNVPPGNGPGNPPFGGSKPGGPGSDSNPPFGGSKPGGPGSDSNPPFGGSKPGGPGTPEPWDNTNGPGKGTDVFDEGDKETPIPNTCTGQHVLIIDLKSGWWSGDGGSTFTDIIVDELQKACLTDPPSVEYHHVIKTSNRTKLYDKAFNVYTQVWILSGSTADPYDIAPSDPRLQEVVNLVKQHKPKLFLGAGFGSVDHVNEFGKMIFGKDAFTTDAKTGDILQVNKNGSNISIVSRFKPGATGNLFTGITGELPDHIQVGNKIAATDEIIPGLAGMTVLANCKSKSQKDVACVAVGEEAGFRMVFDSGIQRFYAIYKNETETRLYLRNIVRALSL